MKKINTQHRTEEEEIMDDFSLKGEELREALDKIAVINRLLGGNTLTLEGIQKLLTATKDKHLTIVDVGCGNGDMLRALADFGKKRSIPFILLASMPMLLPLNMPNSYLIIIL